MALEGVGPTPEEGVGDMEATNTATVATREEGEGEGEGVGMEEEVDTNLNPTSMCHFKHLVCVT